MTDATHNSLTARVADLIRSDLQPLVNDIDRKGVFPATFMHKLGALGGFRAAIPADKGGSALGLSKQIDINTQVGETCGSTAFIVWCQTACAWYLLNTPNHAVQDAYLGPVSRGELLCGTGMSNTVKHLAGIEKMHLKAKRQGDGYIIKGVLPWVSNIEHEHLLIVSAKLEDEDNSYVMFTIPTDAPNLELHACPEFSGMEGTGTWNIRFHDVSVRADQVLAHPSQFHGYIQRIKPGFVLTQTAMGFGVVKGSLNTIAKTNKTHAHVNVYLDDQGDALEKELQIQQEQARHLAVQVQGRVASLLDVLKLRAKVSDLALRAANSAALHAGARGYLMRHPAQRRVREAIFVAIVTPALKHLRKEIHDLESVSQVQAG